MIRKTLTWVVVALVVLLIIFWLLGGGIGKIINNASHFSFSFNDLLSGSSSVSSFQLPFAPDSLPQIPTAYDGSSANPNTPQNGSQSGVFGQAVLAQGGAIAQTPNGQYIELSIAPSAGSIDISGWTLQSSLTALIATIPQAASPFIVGRVNAVGSVVLSPGAIVYLITGPSPIGVSFRENTCTGYLGTLQPFVPPLPQHCPSALSEIPDTQANEARLGASCFAYLRQLPPCVFPSTPPSGLSAACVSTIQSKLSYNGCLSAHQSDADFKQNSWRIYLAHGTPLWGAQHDVIRLLDREGRVVSVLNY